MFLKYRFLAGLAFICISLGGVFLYKNLPKYNNHTVIKNNKVNFNNSQSYKQPTFVGFELIQYLEEKRMSYIKGSKAVIKNRKVGFINFGILKVIAIENPEIGFYALDNTTVEAKINSDYAELDLLTKDIFFQSNVSISSGNKEVTCNAARFTHQDKEIAIKNGFILKNNQEGNNIIGEKLRGNIYLENFSYN